MEPAPLLEKIWDLKYVRTCCSKEFYRRPQYVCTWLHDSKIIMKLKGDPTWVKQRIEGIENENDDAKRARKRLKKRVDNRVKARKGVK